MNNASAPTRVASWYILARRACPADTVANYREVSGRATAGRLILSIALLAVPLVANADGAEVPDWADVSAIFDERCVMCHSAVDGASKGLRLDNYEAALAGSERGEVVVPGDVSGSEMIRRLRGQTTPRMPFLSRPLPEDQIVVIEKWITAGLPKDRKAR